MRKIISLTFLIVTLSFSGGRQCFAQNFADKDYYLIDSLVLEELAESDRKLIDSCLNVYHTAKQDTLRIYAINSICESMINIDWVKYNYWLYDYVIDILHEKHSPINSVIFKKVLSTTLSNIGYAMGQRGDVVKQLEFTEESLKISEEINYKLGLITGCNNLGHIYNNLGDLPKAIHYHQRSLRMAEELNDEYMIATSLNNIGLVNISLGNLDKTLDHFRKSLSLRKKMKDQKGLAVIYNNFGNVYKMKKNLPLALKYQKQSLKIRKELGNKFELSNSLNNIGVIYESLGNYSRAMRSYGESLNLSIEIGNKDGVATSLYYQGDLLFDQERVSEALLIAKKSLAIAKDIAYPKNIKGVAYLLHKIYKKQGKGLKALEMYELHILMRDSINNIETQKATIKQQTKYEYEKQKAVDDTENEKLVAIEKEAKQKQQIITAATAGGLGLTGVFLFFVFNRLRVTRKQKVIIENQKEEVETQKEEVENQRDIAHHQKLIVEIKNKEILESITYAKRIQEAILPPPRLVKEWLTESFIFYKPKDIVAGDFYWMETVEYRHSELDSESNTKTLVFFAAADCTGHGVPGAMVSVVCANALNRAVKEFGLTLPGEVLDKVTELVVEAFDKGDEEIKDGMDIALCALDISAKKVFYSGANNPLYRITKIDKKHKTDAKTVANETHQLIEYKATRQAIGLNDKQVKFETLEIQLEPGDAIYVFSDGFPDQFGGVKGKKYKYSTFRKSLLANFHHPMETQKELLETEFNGWKGDLEQIDDVCVIGVRINGKEKNNFTKRELEVLTHLQEGLSSKLIADKMNISKHTVDTYRRRLLAKTGTYNATELISYCIKKEII